MLAGLLLCAPAFAEVTRLPRGPVAERELNVVNASGRPINEIYISATAASSWGTDRLEESTLAPGAMVRLSLGRTAECSFDVQIIYDDATREDRTGIDVCHSRSLTVDGRQAVPLPGVAARTHLVELTNNSRLPIRQVFISPAYADSWGEDLLARQMSEGETVQIPYRGDCAADLRVVFLNRAAEERRGLDLCAAPQISIAPGWTTSDPLPPSAQSDAGPAIGSRGPPAPLSR